MPDLVIGGAGIFGLTNVRSHFDERTNVEVHTYGPHIFHTSNERVWEYINRFTNFVPYIHRVRVVTPNMGVIPLPFNLSAFSSFYGNQFTPNSMQELIASFPKTIAGTFEEVAIASVGKDMYEEVIKGYTQKQWGRDIKDLPSSIIKRIPIRYSWDDNYFNDSYQGIPYYGYQNMLEQMSNHKNISVQFGVDVLEDNPYDAPLVYTGAMDRYFDYKHGELGWRSVDFEVEYPDTDDYQGCSQMNYSDMKIPYTRIHEYKHYRPDRVSNGTVIHKEYSRDTQRGETGAYPINSIQDREILKNYRDEIKQLNGVWFGGRLGSYKYINMDAAIASALTLWENDVMPYLAKCTRPYLEKQ